MNSKFETEGEVLSPCVAPFHGRRAIPFFQARTGLADLTFRGFCLPPVHKHQPRSTQPQIRRPLRNNFTADHPDKAGSSPRASEIPKKDALNRKVTESAANEKGAAYEVARFAILLSQQYRNWSITNVSLLTEAAFEP